MKCEKPSTKCGVPAQAKKTLNVNTIRNELCKGYNGQIYPGGRPVYDPELAERCSNSHGRQAHREQMMRIASAPPSICTGDDMGGASARDD